MRFAFTEGGRRLSEACRRLAVAGIAAIAGTTAYATAYDEAVSGDLSSVASSPTSIGTLTAGNNPIVGATVPSGPIVDPRTGARAVEDNDT